MMVAGMLGIVSAGCGGTTTGDGAVSSTGGDFSMVHLVWLNWQLKGAEGATGMGR